MTIELYFNQVIKFKSALILKIDII